MNIPIAGDEYRRISSQFTTLQVTAKATPNMTVSISAGSYWYYGSTGPSFIEFAAATTTTITAPASGSKWVLITLDNQGNIIIINGASNSDPSIPALPKNRLQLAAIYIRSTDTVITNDMIFDIRPLMDIIPRSHSNLEDSSSANCHPISAITNLQTTLDELVTISTLNSGLDTKANLAGSSSSSFKLNSSVTGTPDTNASFEVERGTSTNTAIRWNESTETWEYTNDGSTYTPFTSFYLNDGTQDIKIKLYSAATEPTLTVDNTAAFWKNTSDSNKIYIIFRRGSGDQVKVQST